MELNGLTAPGSNGSVLDESNRLQGLGSDDFLELMFTELTNQDPLKPQDSQALLQQIETIRSIESDVAMMDRLEALVGQQEFSAASGLIGMEVEGVDAEGNPIAGSVVSVTREDDAIVLTLADGRRLGLEQVTSIAAPPADGEDGDGDGDGLP